jgi:transposase
MTKLAPTYEELAEENRILREENAELRRMIKELVKIGGLDQKQPKPDLIRENRRHRHQKPGQKEGHEGISRPMPDHVDETKNAAMDQCPDCGGIVSDVGERERIIETIIPAKVYVKLIKVHRYWCPCCGKVVDAPVTDAFPNCRLGLEIYLLVALMRYRIGMTYEKIEEMLQIAYSLYLSKGELPQMMDRLAFEFGDHYRELIQELRRSPSANGDETGWGIDGRPAWLWVFINKMVAVYTIDKSRGKKVVRRVLGRRYEGVLGSDFHSAYNLDGVIQQKCHVHLKRDLKEVAEDKDGRSQFHRFKKKLKRILDDGVRAKKRLKEPSELQEEKNRLDRRVVNLCNEEWKDKDCLRLVKRLRGRGKDLFTFLTRDIDPDNNIAERGIRPAVVMRKNSYGNRSSKGANTTSVMLSVVETCDLKDQNFLDWGKEYIENTLSSNTSFG